MKRTRREFLRDAALGAGTLAIAACHHSKVGSAATAMANAVGGGVKPSIDNAGIQLFTVRDRMQTDFEGTLAALSQIGYREVEFVSYNGKSPQEVKAILDRVGLRAPSTHYTLRAGSPDLEEKLAGFQLMGHKFTRAAPAPMGGPMGGAPPGPPPNGAAPNVTPPAGAPGGPPPGGPPPNGGPPRGGFQMPVPTPETVQREIDAYNEVGRVAQKYGIKVIVHNHTMEFTRFADGRTPMDMMLAQLDPAVAVLELDIGWATVAGQNAIAMFNAHPGRFPLWHVKDMANLAAVNTHGNDEMARMRDAKIVPLGQGEIDYGPIFARAGTAGLEHYFIEQDTAVDSGDSIAAARTSFDALRRLLQG